ncbi:7689_t:CDS:2, partial [Entrophospora sp. SA101]
VGKVEEMGKVIPGASEQPEEAKVHYYPLNNLIAGRKEKLIAWQKQKNSDLVSLMGKLNNLAIANNEKLKKILETQEIAFGEKTEQIFTELKNENLI